MPMGLLGFVVIEREKLVTEEKIVVKEVNYDLVSWYDDRGVIVEVEKVPITRKRRGSTIASHMCKHIRERNEVRI